jgi:hypothetical protein
MGEVDEDCLPACSPGQKAYRCGTSLHGATTQKTVIFVLTAIRTSNPNLEDVPYLLPSQPPVCLKFQNYRVGHNSLDTSKRSKCIFVKRLMSHPAYTPTALET